MTTIPVKHAGLLIPLDMFRISQLTVLFAEQLVGKARNILDASLVFTRHPEAPILLVRIEGSVVEDDPPAFWRENADLAGFASRIFPRQVIMYYCESGSPAERREGFVVAQQGQMLAADDATLDRMPPGATDADWPVSRLCQQLGVSVDELAGGFAGGPEVAVSMVEPNVDDQALLMKLLGRDEEVLDEPAPAPARGAGARPAAGRAKPAAKPEPKVSLSDDVKRRARRQAEQEAVQSRRAAEVSSALPSSSDEVGICVAPKAELGEPELLQPYIRARIDGDLPPGLPTELTDQLQGKRSDVVVRVDFLSEVFVENTPLSKSAFAERSEPRMLGDLEVRVAEVLGPRLGYGTLVSTGRAHVFVSRKLDLPLPVDLVVHVLSS